MTLQENSACYCLHLASNLVVNAAFSNSNAVFSPVQCSVLWTIKNEWKWQYADKACACSLKREKVERAEHLR